MLVVRSSLATDELPLSLRERGATVTEVDAYQIDEAPETSRALLARVVAAHSQRAVVFASGSAVRGLTALVARDAIAIMTAVPAICVGAATAAEAAAHGFSVASVTASERAPDLAREIARALREPPDGA